jgi:hypothetical protein
MVWIGTDINGEECVCLVFSRTSSRPMPLKKDALDYVIKKNAVKLSHEDFTGDAYYAVLE